MKLCVLALLAVAACAPDGRDPDPNACPRSECHEPAEESGVFGFLTVQNTCASGPALTDDYDVAVFTAGTEPTWGSSGMPVASHDNTDGSFELNVPAGSYALCMGNVSAFGSNVFTLGVSSPCVTIQIAGDPVRWDFHYNNGVVWTQVAATNECTSLPCCMP